LITNAGTIYRSSAAFGFDENARVKTVPCYRERAFEHFAILTRIALLCPVFMSYGRTEPVKEFVYDKAPFSAAHASTVVELRNGDLIAAWFGGTKEGAPDVAIWASTLNGRGWSRPIELARENGIATFNPVLFHTRDGRLWLYYKFGPHPTSWTGARRFSGDEGKTWSPVEHLPAGLYGPIRAKPLVLDDGTVVSGTSVESYHSWACWIERSTDNGKTFAKIGPITVAPEFVKPVTPSIVPEEAPGLFEWDKTEGIIQPSVVWLGGHNLRFYARPTSRTGKICVADSNDDGLTWNQAHPIDLPNPNSGIDALALRDGRIVVAYNHSDKRRTPLNLALSRDGEHFKTFRVLEQEPGEYSYPALIQGSTGNLHITYTWNRKRIGYVLVPLSEVPSQ
jgi:predicted neuraminidase